MKFALDCRHYTGEHPCGRADDCDGCSEYDAVGTRILIVKLGAPGDVLRTTALLRGLERAHPRRHVTWLTAPQSRAVVELCPAVDRIIEMDEAVPAQLAQERFDLVVSLDKDPDGCAVASTVAAGDRVGFGLSEYGTICALNPEAEYALALGINDELKFRQNEKTYQEIIFEAARIPYEKDEYVIEIPADARERASAMLERIEIPGRGALIGLNTGAGPIFANKTWSANEFVTLAKKIRRELDARVILLGGPLEAEKNEVIASRLLGAAPNVGCDHTLAEFAGIVAACDLIVTGDTLGMHIGIGTGVKVIALFGPTCAQEVELYGRGERIVTPADCAPCYSRDCTTTPSCVDQITPYTVFASVRRALKTR